MERVKKKRRRNKTESSDLKSQWTVGPRNPTVSGAKTARDKETRVQIQALPPAS